MGMTEYSRQYSAISYFLFFLFPIPAVAFIFQQQDIMTRLTFVELGGLHPRTVMVKSSYEEQGLGKTRSWLNKGLPGSG